MQWDGGGVGEHIGGFSGREGPQEEEKEEDEEDEEEEDEQGRELDKQEWYLVAIPALLHAQKCS